MHLPLFVFGDHELASVAENWFITSEPNNPIINLTKDLVFEYWKQYNYLIHYFFFNMFFKMSTEAYPDEWQKVPFVDKTIATKMQYSMYENYSEKEMKYLASISDFHKLTYKIFPKQASSPSSIYQHIINLSK